MGIERDHEQRRFYILKSLMASANYRMSDVLLQTCLNRVGIGVPLAVIKRDLAWLKDLELLATEDVGGMTMALLRKEGKEVAEGLLEVPGIARPEPTN